MRLTLALVFWALLPFTVLLASCSPAQQEAAAPPALSRHPETGLDVIALSVTSAAKRHDFRVEVARASQDQAKGLMFRTAMAPDEGMLFPMEPPRMASFWMKNTVIPLDIIFIGKDRRIINIAANTVPYSESPLESAGLTAAVLELNGGRAAQLGIGPGDRVEW